MDHMPAPRAEHAWLKQLIGEWTSVHTMNMPDGQVMNSTGTESVSAFGDFWVVLDGVADMPGGGTGRMRLTLGFDSRTEKYVGSWIGSMMDMMWIYDITLSDDKTTLRMAAEGPDFTGSGTMKYEDIITIVDANSRTFTGRFYKDGAWNEMMKATYTRVA